MYFLQAFNNTKHDYEIQLENGSIIKDCPDEPQDSIPQALYHVSFIRTASFCAINAQQKCWQTFVAADIAGGDWH